MEKKSVDDHESLSVQQEETPAEESTELTEDEIMESVVPEEIEKQSDAGGDNDDLENAEDPPEVDSEEMLNEEPVVVVMEEGMGEEEILVETENVRFESNDGRQEEGLTVDEHDHNGENDMYNDIRFDGYSDDDEVDDYYGNESDTYGSDAEDLIYDHYRQAYDARELYLAKAQQLQHQVAELMSKKKVITSISTEEQADPISDDTHDINERYSKYVYEHMKLRNELDELQMSNDQHLEETKMSLQEKQEMRSSEVEAFRLLQIQAAMQSELTGTGKPLNVRLVEHRMKQERRKDKELSELRIRYIHTRNKKLALEAKVKEKEEPSKGLHVIDFEQLKMENSTFSEKTEEKDEALLKSKLKATMIVHTLSHIKEKLQFEQSEESDMIRRFAQLKDDQSQHREVLSQMKRERGSLRDRNTLMKDQKPLVASDSLLFDYENRRTEKTRHLSHRTELKERYQMAMDRVNAYQSIIDEHERQLQQQLLSQHTGYRRPPPIKQRKR